MNQPAIRVENLSKRFYIGARQEPYQTLREALVRIVAAPLRRAAAVWRGRSTDASENAIWALKDVSFRVEPGETVGIIGRNGAGKSTLLKVLTRITDPTEGELGLNGRVGSLLEVGTGFHPELTGRENVYLNGAILGMRKTEIEAKFDEIVEFAEVAKFLDTPVKYYSTGMYMRLAFAVAAHLEPEILIVDEVLAVGDAGFQKKCLEKMKNVGQHGHTVLFVSHNMQAITQLCTRAILLDSGRVIQDGPAHEVVSSYLNPEAGTSAAREWPDRAQAPGDDVARLCAVRVRGLDGEIADSFDIRLPIAVELEYEVLKPGHIFHPHFGLTNQDGVALFVAQDVDRTWRGRTRPPGRYISTALIPGNFLAEGRVYINPAMCSLNPNTLHFYEQGVVAFNVVDCFLADDTARGDYPTPVPGVVRPLLEWSTQYWPNGHEASLAGKASKAKT